MKKGWRNTSEQEFNLIKLLLANGASESDITKATGRSSGTIWFMKKADTYQGYKKFMDDYKKKKASQKEQEQSNGVVHRDREILKELSAITKQITRIAESLRV